MKITSPMRLISTFLAFSIAFTSNGVIAYSQERISPIRPQITARPITIQKPVQIQPTIAPPTTTLFLSDSTSLKPVSPIIDPVSQISTSPVTISSVTRKREEPNPVATKRKELLLRVDSKLNEAQTEREKLKTQLAEVQVQLNQKIESLNADVSSMTETLGGFVAQLESMKDHMSVEAKAPVEEYIQKVNDYLKADGQLTNEQRDYIDALSKSYLAYLEAELESWDQYIVDLMTYRSKVLAAQTMSQLFALENEFPVKSTVPVPSILLPVSPLVGLEKLLEEGKALIESIWSDFREELLDRTNLEMSTAETEIAQLQDQLVQAEAQLAENIANFNAEVSQKVEALKTIASQLEELSADLPEDLKVVIRQFVDQVNAYLGGPLTEEQADYIRALTASSLFMLKAEIQSWTQYLEDLKVYRDKVLNATFEELILLTDQFSQRGPIPMISFSMPISPLEHLDKLIAEANALLEKAELQYDIYQRVRELIFDVVATTFGLSKETVARVARVEIDFGNLQAKVSIDSHLQVSIEAVNLSDLLGSVQLPELINFKLGITPDVAMLSQCILNPDGTADCPPVQPPTYYLHSGEFKIGERFVQLNYMPEGYIPEFSGDNRLRSVRIYDGNPYLVCIQAPCPTGKLVKEVSFEYYDIRDIKGPYVVATIKYLDDSQGKVTSRMVEFKRMTDGANHIQNVIDYDQEGNVIVRSDFLYAIAIHPPCDPATGCEPDKVILMKIVRTGVNADPLSEITDIGPNPEASINSDLYQAVVVLPQGTGVRVTFNTIEELLSKVLVIEQQNAERTLLLNYLESVRSAQESFVSALTSEWQKVKAMNPVLTMDALKALTSSLNLPQDQLQRFVHLHLYFDYMKAMADFIVSGGAGILNLPPEIMDPATGQVSQAFKDFMASGGLDDVLLFELFALPPDPTSLSLDELAELVDPMRSVLGDDPAAYFSARTQDMTANVAAITEDLNRINQESTDLKNQDTERTQLLNYLDAVKVAQDSFVNAVKSEWQKIHDMNPILTMDELKVVIDSLNLPEDETTRLVNLHLYFDYMKAMADFIVSGATGSLNLPPWFKDFMASEGLDDVLLFELFAIPVDPSSLSLDELKQLVDPIHAVIGDDPQAYFANQIQAVQVNVSEITTDLHRINQESTDLKNQDTERTQLLNYLDAVKVAQDSFVNAVKSEWQKIHDMNPILTMDELKVVIDSLNLPEERAERLINLHLYFDYMMAMADFIVSGGAGILNLPIEIVDPATGQVSQAFKDFMASEGLDDVLLFELFALPTDPGSLSTDELKQIVDEIRAAIGDDPAVDYLINPITSYFMTQTSAVQTNVMAIISDLNEINQEFSAPNSTLTVIGLAVNDLVTTFGIPREVVNQAIQSGLIKIIVADLDALTVEVTIDPSIQLPVDAVNLSDLLGSNRLPSSIKFKLGMTPGVASLRPCILNPDGTADCPPPPTPTYYLHSGEFNVGERFVQLNYMPELYTPEFSGDNRLHSVKIYNGNPYLVCIQAPCPTGKLVKVIKYTYPLDSTIAAHIFYADEPWGNVGERTVKMRLMSDGMYHIQNVVDFINFVEYGQGRNPIVRSEFTYAIAIHPPCDPVTGCEPDKVILMKIIRTDINAEALSEITDIGPNPEASINSDLYQAVVVLPQGTGVRVTFNTIEELLSKALVIERPNAERTELLNYLESVRTSQDSFVNAVKSEWQKIHDMNPILTMDELKVVIDSLNLPEERAERLINLHLYFDYMMAMADFIVSGGAGILNLPPEIQDPNIPGQVAPWFQSSMASEGLDDVLLFELFALPTDPGSLSTDELKQIVDEIRAAIGDDPAANYFANPITSFIIQTNAVRTNVSDITADLSRINQKFANLKKSAVGSQLLNLIGDAKLDIQEQINSLNDLINTYSADYDLVMSSVAQLDSNVNTLESYNDKYLGLSFFSDLKSEYDNLMSRMNSDLSNLDQAVSDYKTKVDQAIENINIYHFPMLSNLNTIWNNLEREVIEAMNNPDVTVEQLLEIQTRFPEMNLQPVPDTQPVFAYADLLQKYLTETDQLKKKIQDRIMFYNITVADLMSI